MGTVYSAQLFVCMSVCVRSCTLYHNKLYVTFFSCFIFSYDSLVPASDVGGVNIEPAPPPPKQWWVSSRWLTDSDQFNEWMTEEDYELTIVVSQPSLAHCIYCLNRSTLSKV